MAVDLSKSTLAVETALIGMANAVVISETNLKRSSVLGSTLRRTVIVAVSSGTSCKCENGVKM